MTGVGDVTTGDLVGAAAGGSRRTSAFVLLLGALGSSLAGVACSSAHAAAPAVPARSVAAAPPPKDDGRPAQAAEAEGGVAHAAALEQLRTAQLVARADKQNSLVVVLPDAEHWTRVRFLTVKSLVGFRYGKAHHAVVAAFVTHVPDNQAQGACSKSFEDWAKPYVDAFEVELKHDAPAAFAWSPPTAPPVILVGPKPPAPPKTVAIVEVDPLMAKTATILARDTYAGAWAAYPVWENACLIVGAAIPSRGEDDRARAVRDRFVKDVLPKVKVLTTTEPKERF
jgi:hypothetical protein